MKNLNGKVEFVLPRYVQERLCTLSSSSLVSPKLEDVREDPVPPIQAVLLPSQSQYGGIKAESLVSHSGKRKKNASPTVTKGGCQSSATASEIASPQKKKKDASEVKSARSLFSVGQEMQHGGTSDGVAVLKPPSPEEEDGLKCDLILLLDPALNAEDRQHLLDAAAVFKSNLVACLTSSADTMRTKDMINLASRCYNILGELGDDYASFRSEIEKLIAQHQKVEFSAKYKENWNEWDIKPRYIHQEQFLSKAREDLSSAQDKLSAAKTKAELLKFKKEELADALHKITEELYEEEKRVKDLTAERDRFKEAHSDIEIGLVKLDAEKKAASVALEAYKTAKEEFERISNHLLQLLCVIVVGRASSFCLVSTFQCTSQLALYQSNNFI
ncbi:hypothetical protein DCAR_0104387 [Daucus carota subsp. sativus]|uniref:Uncharacterized protein n=1 Tax=Daucus carota subsp. sativus TaxID=79200 RepID=A0A166ISZ2_DAUCS|nr:hypothetical protein DCAR_0104387 [Daucus carota subsp. sativus]